MLGQYGTFSGTVTLGLQSVSHGQCRDYLEAVLVMTEGHGSPVLLVSVGTSRALGTAAGRTVGKHSTGLSAGASGGSSQSCTCCWAVASSLG